MHIYQSINQVLYLATCLLCPSNPLVHWTIWPLVHWSIGPLVECKMSKVNRVKFINQVLYLATCLLCPSNPQYGGFSTAMEKTIMWETMHCNASINQKLVMKKQINTPFWHDTYAGGTGRRLSEKRYFNNVSWKCPFCFSLLLLVECNIANENFPCFSYLHFLLSIPLFIEIKPTKKSRVILFS